MNIPDFISPIIAWRVWQWDATGLSSLNGEPWLPGKSLRAGCRVVATAHEAPQFHCTCGIYGSKSLEHLRRTQFWEHGGIHGEVSLWGSVVEHEAGYRAELAYPKTFYVSSKMLPITLKEIQTRIQVLVGYRSDLFISHDGSNIPLWAKESGLDEAGLEFLISRAEGWHARRKCERSLRKGDRIAVLGGGIALVEQVTKGHVHAVLWNRSVLHIRRKEIIWESRNMRWECRPSHTNQGE